MNRYHLTDLTCDFIIKQLLIAHVRLNKSDDTVRLATLFVLLAVAEASSNEISVADLHLIWVAKLEVVCQGNVNFCLNKAKNTDDNGHIILIGVDIMPGTSNAVAILLTLFASELRKKKNLTNSVKMRYRSAS